MAINKVECVAESEDNENNKAKKWMTWEYFIWFWTISGIKPPVPSFRDEKGGLTHTEEDFVGL